MAVNNACILGPEASRVSMTSSNAPTTTALGPTADSGRVLAPNRHLRSRRLSTTRARKWIDILRGMVDKQPCDALRPAAERLAGRFAFRRSRLPDAGPFEAATTANPLIVRFLPGAECMRERSARQFASDSREVLGSHAGSESTAPAQFCRQDKEIAAFRGWLPLDPDGVHAAQWNPAWNLEGSVRRGVTLAASAAVGGASWKPD